MGPFTGHTNRFYIDHKVRHKGFAQGFVPGASHISSLMQRKTFQAPTTSLVRTQDDAVRGALVLENGEMMWPPPQLAVSLPSLKHAPASPCRQQCHSCCTYMVFQFRTHKKPCCILHCHLGARVVPSTS